MRKIDWISVDERLPEVGIMVLVAIDIKGAYIFETDCLKEDKTWKYTSASKNSKRDKVIGWCSIPDLPQRILKKVRKYDVRNEN